MTLSDQHTNTHRHVTDDIDNPLLVYKSPKSVALRQDSPNAVLELTFPLLRPELQD